MKEMPATLYRYFSKHSHLLLLGFIILLAVFLRLLFLDRIPNIVTSDELTYFLTIKAMVLTGHDIAGAWNPWSVFLFHYPPGQIQAELPYFLFLPLVGLTPFSLFTAHLTNAILSTLIVVLVYLIAKKLFDTHTALVAGLLTAINPWLIVTGRTGYEVVPATLFFLLALFLLLTFTGKKILFTVPVLILAFYSYIATKTILFLYLLVSCLYIYFYVRVRKDGIFYIFLLSICLIFTAVYIALIMSHPGVSRLDEILTPFSGSVALQVDALRKTSIVTEITPFFINKFSVYFSILAAKLFSSLSFDYLFVTGDSFFGFWNHGIFYLLDGIFLLWGVLELFRKNGKLLLFLTAMIGIGLVPQLLHGVSVNNFTPHITLIFPFVLLIVAYGIICAIRSLSRYRLQGIGVIVILLLYAVSLLGFMHNYFYQNSLQKQTAFSDRVLSRYISLAGTRGRDVNVYSPRQSEVFEKYLFYANAYNSSTASQVHSVLKSHRYALGTVRFLSCNPAFVPSPDSVSVYDVECGIPETTDKSRKIKQLSDGGDSYLIYNDTTCSSYPLKSYPYGMKLSDFQVESLSASAFCSSYIFQ